MAGERGLFEMQCTLRSLELSVVAPQHSPSCSMLPWNLATLNLSSGGGRGGGPGLRSGLRNQLQEKTHDQIQAF
uniref:Uncharacterized protein n=1 Tax=Knipowitschia caucasica TaxID=637954 RepID=A0AAV2LE65_KNICA